LKSELKVSEGFKNEEQHDLDTLNDEIQELEAALHRQKEAKE
jgi:hypothetical protein